MSTPPEALHKALTVKNRLGLHMRAAKLLMEALAPFDAEVSVSNGDKSANGRSILSLVTLEAVANTEVQVTASGPQAAEALAAVEKLFDERFGEPE